MENSTCLQCGRFLRTLCGTLLLMAVVLCLPGTVAAQTAKTIKLMGQVFDEQKQPVAGASVIVKGTAQGIQTDAAGKFSFSAEVTPKSILLVQFLGMEPAEQVIGQRTSFQFTLKEDNAQIENVVVTGFQTISKTTFTGSATKLKVEDMNIKGVTDVSRMLEGAAAGVAIQNVSGTFGAAPKVRVRGVTSINGENKPLWVIDGVVQEDIVTVSNDDLTSGDPTTLLGSAVAGISASDIESIDILKDASATALYGARAMNGVVVVTTKKGREGAPVVNYNGTFTIQLRPSYANYDIMNSYDQMSVYAELERKGYLNSDIVNASNSGVYGKMYKQINTYNEKTGRFELENTPEAKRDFLMRYARANTDWFKVLFRNSLQQEHALSISAGGAKSRTYASVSFLHDDGWSVADRVNRYTANLRNNFKVARWLDLGFQLTGSLRQQRAPGSLARNANVVSGNYDRDFDINPFSFALNTSRALTPYDENGNREYFTRNFAPFNILSELENNYIDLTVADLKVQFDLGAQICKGLRWEFTAAGRYAKSDREHQITEHANMAEAYRADYTSTIRAANKFLWQDPDNPNAEKISVLPYGGFYNRSEDMLLSYDMRNSLKYTTNFNESKHTLNAIGGVQIKYADRQRYSNTGYGYQYDEGGTVATDWHIMRWMIEGNFPYYAMSTTRDRFAAFYANFDYSYDARYVVSATVRYDGSNALGRNASARWLPTYNFGGKWNIMNEPFLKEKARWIDQLSLRASYGLTATMPPSASAAAIFRNYNSTRPSSSEIESVIRLESLANNELTWEKAYQTNVGADISLFKHRLNFVFDYWWRNSFDLISSITTAGIGGQMTKRANYADMESHGYDITVSGAPVRMKDFSWNSNFTFGFSTNKITNAKHVPNIYNLIKSTGGNIEGYPVGSLFSIVYKGLDHETGIPTFINEKGEQSSKVYFQSTDTQYLKYEGPVDPKITGGWSNTFRYKNLSLNVFLTFQGGNKIRLDPVFKMTYSDLDAMPDKFFDRWVQPGDERNSSVGAIAGLQIKNAENANYPYSSYNYSTERTVDGGFIRLKTISLTYALPEDWMKRSRVFKKIALTAAMSNVCLLYADKRLNGQDPEFFNTGGVASPLPRQITFALNLGF